MKKKIKKVAYFFSKQPFVLKVSLVLFWLKMDMQFAWSAKFGWVFMFLFRFSV